jgi:hypothetical protein
MSRRPVRQWLLPVVVAVLSPLPIASLLMQVRMGLLGQEQGSFGVNVSLALIPVLTGLATALAARLRRWWLLVPAGTCLAVGAVLFLLGSVFLSDAPEGEGGELVAFLLVGSLLPLGALAGVALADYLTRDGRQGSDVGELRSTQEDSPVG